MRNRPIHENLDTSFVNLSALVKYLRRRQFVGFVRIDFGKYAGEIHLMAEDEIKAFEHDQNDGRNAENVEILRRILIRSREPGGIISVYETVGENKIIEKAGTKAENKSPVARAEKPSATPTELPQLPFEFSNNVEKRAQPAALSTKEREMLLNLTGELLGSIDRRLAQAKLEFSPAFRKACAEIAADYPFLSTLDYRDGRIYDADAQINPKIFVAGVCEAVRRILEKLAQNPQFSEIYRDTTQSLLGLIHRQRRLYDRFSLTAPLERILGV